MPFDFQRLYYTGEPAGGKAYRNAASMGGDCMMFRSASSGSLPASRAASIRSKARCFCSPAATPRNVSSSPSGPLSPASNALRQSG